MRRRSASASVPLARAKKLTSTRVHRRFRARCCGRLLVVRNSGQCTRVQQRSGCSGRWVRLTERTAHRRPRLLVSARTSRRLASLRSVAAACRPRPTAALAVAAPSLAATPERALPAHLSRASAKALLLGEGNFSFAAALSRQHPSLCLFATSLESQEQALGLWGAGAALQELRERPQRVEVLHSVDATKLEQSPLHRESFDAGACAFTAPACSPSPPGSPVPRSALLLPALRAQGPHTAQPSAAGRLCAQPAALGRAGSWRGGGGHPGGWPGRHGGGRLREARVRRLLDAGTSGGRGRPGAVRRRAV